ncbi:MAG: hypothetical protein R6W82_03350 [bacterium]
MHVDLDHIKHLADQRGWTLTDLLEEAGVSRNAFYSLARRESILPDSIESVAETLGVSAGTILVDESPQERWARRLWEEVETVRDRAPEVDTDNVRHTLILLKEPPIERLRRSLRRGRTAAVR